MSRAVVLDLDSDMEVSQALCQDDRLQLIAEKRKWQTEIENKKRQLEDDRRALQHLKSKALRERWLLDGQEQDEVKRQLEQDEAKTRSLEETINRLERELVNLETGAMCQTITQTTVTSGPVKVVEVKGHSGRQPDRAAPTGQLVQEVKVHKSPRMNKPRDTTEEMKRAMYSVEIKVERDRLTGETRVLSTNTTLPVDLSHQGVKVYEDEQKVVHEMNGEDVHLLSSTEVEELIHKADEASMMSQAVTTVTSLPSAEVQEEEEEEEVVVVAVPEQQQQPPVTSEPQRVTGEIMGLETKPSGGGGAEPSNMAEASAENPVTMVFMGYQSVEDEAETKRVLGLQGTVTAELVVIEDGANGKTPSPVGNGKEEEEEDAGRVATAAAAKTASPLPPESTSTSASTDPLPPSSSAKPLTAAATPASNGETAVEVKKEKQLCKCCSIM